MGAAHQLFLIIYIIRLKIYFCGSIIGEGKTGIVCHIYNVDKNKNCNECIKVIMEIISKGTP